MNTQPILKQNLLPDGALSVHSIFSSVQGEGPFVGQPAVFVRLHGCNLQCPLCDTNYSYPCAFTKPTPQTLTSTVSALCGAATLVVITGGEPFRQNLTPFVNALLDQGFRVQIETNGTLFLPRGNGEDPGFPYYRVTIVCSPKTGKINKKY